GRRRPGVHQAGPSGALSSGRFGFLDHDAHAALHVGGRVVMAVSFNGFAALFDYASVEPGRAAELKLIAARVREGVRKTFLDVAHELTAAKAMIEHGQFLAWVEAEIGISPRAAQDYMTAVAFLESKGAKFAHLKSSVIQKIAAPSFPPEALDAIETK